MNQPAAHVFADGSDHDPAACGVCTPVRPLSLTEISAVAMVRLCESTNAPIEPATARILLDIIDRLAGTRPRVTRLRDRASI